MIELDELAGPDGGDKGQKLADFWRRQITKVKDDVRYKRWLKRAEKIEKRYRDERVRTEDTDTKRCNILWTNTEILMPAIYGKCPQPIAERKFKDKDPIGRGAAQILERGLRNEIEICSFDETMQQVVKDYLLAGRGTAWVRYEPEVEQSIFITSEGGMDIDSDDGRESENESDSSDSDEGVGGANALEPVDEDPAAVKLRETGDRVVRESTPVDFIHWSDFFTLPFNARTWKEVTAIAKRVYMTRDQMVDRFGKKIGRAIPLKQDDRGATRYDSPEQDPEDKGEVYEIWSLTDKSVFWVAENYDFLCDRKDDPLGLEGFFPCPRPLFANTTNSTLIPVPDYIEYQDQALQIDELTQRISMLTKACKVAGLYNAAAKDIQRLLQESTENKLIPVDDWAAFAEKGGVAGNMSLLPLKEIIGCINELQIIKEKTVVELDRLTGINDVMRGTTDARETLGGQRLKVNSTGTRLTHRQNEVARFARDLVKIMADIMAQHFSPVSLIEVSGALYEEGLGPSDMPTLGMLQSGGIQAPPTPQLPGPAPMGQPPAMGGGPAGPAPMPAGPPQGLGGPPQPPTGNNVVPFHAPGMPMPVAGLPPAPPPPMPPEMIAKLKALKRISDAIDLLRNERLRGFRVDIEVDSTIYGDAQQEKGDRTQFITAVTQFLQQAMAMSAQVPEITPLMGKMLQFGVRGFRVGRDLETAIEEFCDEAVVLSRQKQQQAQQQPNPQAMMAQAAVMKAQSTVQTNAAKSKREDAKLGLDAQAERERNAADAMQAHAEINRQALENQGEQANSNADLQMKQMDMQMREMELRIMAMKERMEQMKVVNRSNDTIRAAVPGAA